MTRLSKSLRLYGLTRAVETCSLSLSTWGTEKFHMMKMEIDKHKKVLDVFNSSTLAYDSVGIHLVERKLNVFLENENKYW